jgi:hypothetical protein
MKNLLISTFSVLTIITFNSSEGRTNLNTIDQKTFTESMTTEQYLKKTPLYKKVQIISNYADSTDQKIKEIKNEQANR